jgi:hypothetical protein|tara:strand:+ start:561 stop:764 length:204 start_codon:yes stop_codon:yes gene_type:complete
MSIITENVDVETKSFTANAWNSIKEFKDKYCPDGTTCDNILSFALVIGCFVFMYIAMKPIFYGPFGY